MRLGQSRCDYRKHFDQLIERLPHPTIARDESPDMAKQKKAQLNGANEAHDRAFPLLTMNKRIRVRGVLEPSELGAVLILSHEAWPYVARISARSRLDRRHLAPP